MSCSCDSNVLIVFINLYRRNRERPFNKFGWIIAEGVLSAMDPRETRQDPQIFEHHENSISGIRARLHP